MKRLIALRRLKNHCIDCNKSILKGEIYYKHRTVINDWELFGYNTYYCPRCKIKKESHDKRYKEFQKKCTHPYEFIATEWDYIPGECVKEPQYDFCTLCGEILD